MTACHARSPSSGQAVFFFFFFFFFDRSFFFPIPVLALRHILLTAVQILQRWPFLSEQEAAQIEGRVDSLYRALLHHRISRVEAARQIHTLMQNAESAASHG